MSSYVVTASALNLRSQPLVAPRTRLATLSHGQEVKKLQAHPVETEWWEIETRLNGILVSGYVNSQYLKLADSLNEPALINSISAVHLPTKQKILRSKAGGRAFPLNETGMPSRTATTASGKVQELYRIIDWLEVETSERYRKAGGQTYCNIYAYDYCCLGGAYLPRVWWNRRAIAELAKGHPVPVQYEKTVTELNANSLYNWFDEFASDFGWERSFDIGQMQEKANAGSVCIISAQRVDLNRSGHICAVVPEAAAHPATRKNGLVVRAVQSQAGDSNFSYGGSVWWTSSKFRGFSFWTHP